MSADGNPFPHHRRDVRVRDPFIVADPSSGLYHLYRAFGDGSAPDSRGVLVQRSPDLVHWSEPSVVWSAPAAPAVQAVWAPEVHAWRGRWYLLVTLTGRELLSDARPPLADPAWPPLFVRGTHVLVADHLDGPFRPLREGSLTPAEQMALDGTLCVDGDTPWLVWCHEWVQIRDGAMVAAPLTDDLSGLAGPVQELFRGSAAPGASTAARARWVTDGPWLFRDSSGALRMLWSTHLPPHTYALVVARSDGGVSGPWTEHNVLDRQDGGHGMIFRDFAGNLRLAMHRPNGGGRERLTLFSVEDRGGAVRLLLSPEDQGS